VIDLPDRCQRLLRLQRGVIATWQADYAGLSVAAMTNLVRTGRWCRLHRGVYAAFTGEPPRDAVLWAAVLRAGPRSLLSHETAAETYGLKKPSRLIHVTVPDMQRLRPTRGLTIHRSARNLEQIRAPGPLPRTMVEETVLDLAQTAGDFDDVVALLAGACQRRLTFPVLLRQSLDARPKSRWRAEIREALADVADGAQSPLEHRYLRNVERAHGLPTGERQARAVQNGRAIFRDVRYRKYHVVVELDGVAYHPAEKRIEDNRRDNAAGAQGLVTLRYGWSAVTKHPCETAAEVAAVLRRRGWTGQLRRCGADCELPRS
jgi:very-short-patch-repair endonuclease